MTTKTTFLAISTTQQRWHDFWRGPIGEWVITKGLRIVMLLIAAVLAARFVTWVAQRVTRRLDVGFTESDALVRSEATKHRQAVASVISWVSIAIICVVVVVQLTTIMSLSVGSLVAPAAVLGAALGFGAQRVVQDLLGGFFIIIEKQYGFGDLVSLTVAGIAAEARGTVEDVTLRVTKLRSSDGEVFTIPNGQIVKTVNLSKDWARAVVDIPVSTSVDLNRVNAVLHQECEHALDDAVLGELLLDAPTVMGVESIEIDTLTLRLVARTLPGKQFEAGRQLRVMVIRALARAGIMTAADATIGVVDDAAVSGSEIAADADVKTPGRVQ
jgi:small-conductance mechanosensitive channel